METHNGKGQTVENALKTIFYQPQAAPENRHPFTPTAKDIDLLQGVDVFTVGGGPTVLDQVHLEVAGFVDVPG
jgi:hypothetical protein